MTFRRNPYQRRPVQSHAHVHCSCVQQPPPKARPAGSDTVRPDTPAHVYEAVAAEHWSINVWLETWRRGPRKGTYEVVVPVGSGMAEKLGMRRRSVGRDWKTVAALPYDLRAKVARVLERDLAELSTSESPPCLE